MSSAWSRSEINILLQRIRFVVVGEISAHNNYNRNANNRNGGKQRH